MFEAGAVGGVESALCASGDTGFDEESVGVDSETCRHGDIREAHVSGRIQEIPQTVITSLASRLVKIAVDAAFRSASSQRRRSRSYDDAQTRCHVLLTTALCSHRVSVVSSLAQCTDLVRISGITIVECQGV